MTAWAIALPAAVASAKVIERFDDASPWRAVASDQVSAKLRAVEGAEGQALCLDYDFNGVSGYAAMRRALPLTFPAHYEFEFRLRGEAPVNDLQFKLIDASGENVWWVNRPKTVLPNDWQPVRYRQRHIDFAWGPTADKALRATAELEFTIYAHEGGRGEVCFDQLSMRELPPPPSVLPAPVATVSSARPGAPAANVLDGDAVSAWRSAAGAQWLALDFGAARELGGVRLRWRDGEHAARYRLQLSDDGRDWRTVRTVTVGDGGVDALHLPETEARHLRMLLTDGPGDGYGLAAIELLPPMHVNAFVEQLAKAAPRGRYPRGFTGEQAYWTVVGIDGGLQNGLLSEDGALEVARGGYSIEPFLLLDDTLVSWADAERGGGVRHSLLDGYLPIPSVEWRHGDLELAVTAFATGTREHSRLLARYRLRNRSREPRTVTLALAMRPFQVNPPTQFLNTAGGVSPIERISWDGRAVAVNERSLVRPLAPPDAFVATPFDAGTMPDRLLTVSGGMADQSIGDESGLASGALLYRIELPANGTRVVALDIPLTGEPERIGVAPSALAEWLSVRQREAAAEWREKLDRVRLRLPAEARTIADTMRTALAHVLINRHGVEIRPGTRSYGRSWIRDGAMTSEALLRLGHTQAAADFLAWYAPHQFKNGKVPCCVDYRGSDPVPENDSHGELIHLAAETWRYGRDRALLERLWPHVDAAVRYMDQLRLSERTPANLTAQRRPQHGLMPPSISHEGYSAKPAYSYWDDFWALTGYKQAVVLAEALGREDDARRIVASRDQFHRDLLASIGASAKLHGIDYIPGAAELGDFDATSTTIALSPAGEQATLPPDLLRNTFERYWREFVARRDGKKEWDAYTPYELRNVGAFVRLGWRERAHELLDFFFADRRPAGWNQWAEVVGRDYRTPRFIGDMPHGWVASDYIRSALDLFAYERDADRALVLAAGATDGWLDGEGIAVEHLRTPYGPLGYTLRRDEGIVRLDITADPKPPGGLVLRVGGDVRSVRVNGDIVVAEAGEIRVP